VAKEKGNKKKLSAKAFTAIVAPLLAILLAFSIVLSVVTTSRFDLVLRDIFGETDFSKGSAGHDIDANYYTRAPVGLRILIPSTCVGLRYGHLRNTPDFSRLSLRLLPYYVSVPYARGYHRPGQASRKRPLA